jgi:hypothetical protein
VACPIWVTRLIFEAPTTYNRSTSSITIRTSVHCASAQPVSPRGLTRFRISARRRLGASFVNRPLLMFTPSKSVSERVECMHAPRLIGQGLSDLNLVASPLATIPSPQDNRRAYNVVNEPLDELANGTSVTICL